MNNTPIFSIIMACHNAAFYVQQAIASVVCQTFTNWELIIVDDASQDNSLTLIKKASQTDSRIKYISMAVNVGSSAARNTAIGISKGEWLAILDADDVFLPYKLEKQFEIIRRHNSSLVLVGGGCFHINSEGLRSKEYKYSSNSKTLKKELNGRLKFPPHSSIVYRKSAFLKVGDYNQIFSQAEDYDIWLRLSKIGDFTSCTLPLIEYRIHSTNKSNQISKHGFSHIEYGIAARVCQLLRENGHVDPSATGNDQLWHELMSHVSLMVRQLGYYKYSVWKGIFKQNLEQSINFLKKLQRIVIQIAQSPYCFVYLIREQIFGIDFSDKIFKLWVAKIISIKRSV
jgi:glycosyltransferase involved in cell wall biosynthesis